MLQIAVDTEKHGGAVGSINEVEQITRFKTSSKGKEESKRLQRSKGAYPPIFRVIYSHPTR